MKIKRIFVLAVAVMLACAIAVTPFSASAIVTADSGTLRVLPGNTMSSSPVYNMAWLDNIIIRDDVMAITQATIVPKPEYPYSHTYDEFIKDVSQYKLLEGLNEETVEQGYEAIVNTLFYVVTACGMTIDEDGMRKYIVDQGIRLPDEMTALDKTKTAVVYAAIKYDAVYTLYGKKVTFAEGTTLDGAITIILAELLGTPLPSGINTVLGFGMYNLKNYVSEFEEIPMSENPSNSEIFHWVKIIVAAEQEYMVPLTEYDEATQAQKDYVDYAYYASIFNTIYDIHISPAALAMADVSGEPNEVARLIVKTMLNEKGVTYSDDADCETLFDLACQNGCFMLEEEFYTDVLNYEVYVDKNCEKLWFTPFVLASQIGGSNEYVTIYLGDKVMKHSSTSYAPLDLKKEKETVTMLVEYNDGNGTVESATYTFDIIKVDKGTLPVDENDILANIQNQVNTVVPQSNEKASELVSQVFDAIDNQITPPTTQNASQNILSTYPAEPSTINGYNGEAQSMGSGADFDYLNQLFSETYATGSAGLNMYGQTSEAETSLAKKAAETVKENPEIVAAPTSILAVGLLAGYMFNFKKKSGKPEGETEDK